MHMLNFLDTFSVGVTVIHILHSIKKNKKSNYAKGNEWMNLLRW